MLSDLGRKVAETFSTRVALILIGFTASVLVARALGPEGRGLFAVATVIAATGVQLGNLGLYAANTYYAARSREHLPTLVGNSLAAASGIGGLLCAGTWLVLSRWPEWSPLSEALLALALLSIPLGLAYLFVQHLLLGLQEVRAYNQIELVGRLLGVAAIAGLLVLGHARVLWVYGAGLVGTAVSALWALRRLGTALEGPVQLSYGLMRETVRYGIKAYISALVSFLVLRIDLLLIRYLVGEAAVGYYSIAVTMGDVLYTFPAAVGTILFPHLTAMDGVAQRRQVTSRVVRGVMIAMIVASGAAAVLARPAVGLLFGEAFLPAVPAFLWLIPAIYVLSVNSVYMNYFAADGLPSVVIWSPALALLVNITLNLAWIPRMGITGAAAASLVAYGVMLLCSLAYMRNREGSP